MMCILLLNIFSYIPPYILFVCLAFLISSIFLVILMYRDNIININLPKYIIVTIVSIYVGAILFSILSSLIDDIINNSSKNVLLILFSGNYGLVYYGGLFGLLLSTYIFVERKILSNKVYNNLALIIPLFHSISRVGCYFAGCCYGMQNKYLYQLPHFINGFFNGEYRVPTQLYESIFEALLLILISLLYYFINKNLISNKVKDLNLLTVYLFFYANFRFFIEFLRGDKIRGIYFGLSFSQYISIVLLLFIIFSKLIFRRKKV